MTSSSMQLRSGRKIIRQESESEDKEALAESGNRNATKLNTLALLAPASMQLRSGKKIMRQELESESENEDAVPSVLTGNRNPMKMNTVVKCVFGYLNVKNLKKCRTVNSLWNAVAEPLLRKRSTIVFRMENTREGRKKHPEEFLKTFSNTLTKYPFTSFEFHGLRFWPLSMMNNFFDKQKTFIKELELHNANLSRNDQVPILSFPLSQWIGNSITKLNITSERTGVSYVVDLSQILLIKDLTLYGVKINIQEGHRITPKYCNFQDVQILQKGEYVKSVPLNSFLNLKDIFDLSLACYNDSTDLILDLEETFHAEEINLEGNVRVVNWRHSKSSVVHLHLESVLFVEKCTMKIKNLMFQDHTINLCALPDNIENISITMTSARFQILPSHRALFPNLKSLTLDLINMAPLAYFANCVSLVDLDISTLKISNDCQSRVDLRFIPKSVKRLKMLGTLRCRSQLTVDTLILECTSLSRTAELLRQISPNILVINWNKGYETNESICEFVQEFKHKNIAIYVGPFHWNDPKRKFRNSIVSKLVDREYVYYCFKNGKGRAVSINEFCKISRK